MCGKSFLVDSREENSAFINKSSSEGVKRFESGDCSPFGFGEGFKGAGDVVFSEMAFCALTTKPRYDGVDGVLLCNS